ncbi:LytTR family DNA-binding domain-containing protein [Christiangramia sp.]|uniref:LytR/AlgR family response regulator transcription factor n=1 Tax=Christiangramia sp. TaxID=1931228 RepID=UPI0026266A9D|nr:LytTR family DNA-binding domain-containing protein [Christiangramia sp.]
MNCVIIDDEELPRKILSQLIDSEPTLNLLEIFNNPVEALKFINTKEITIDLIFLDVLMPHLNGFDLIKSVPSHPYIILVSAEKNYALNAFEYENVIDYLLKPVQKERFKKAIQKVLQTQKKADINEIEKSSEIKESELYINSDKRLIKINIPEILIIEAKGNFIYIKTIDDNYLTYSSLKKIEAKLPGSIFIRIHRSYIINFKKIIDIQDNSILIGKEIIPLSRRYKAQLLSRLNLL